MTMTTLKIRPSWFYEDQHSNRLVAGVDEAGCGPWAGPVVAGAVIIHRESFPENILSKINDSKKISHRMRVWVYEEIKDHPAVEFAVGMASVDEIDALNIANATKLAMVRACSALKSRPCVALIDGIRRPDLSDTTIEMLKQGDQKSFSIALASIVAKVTRDRLMDTLDKEYPMYQWGKNAGYGTRIHQEAIQQWGITPHHRRSFAPIRERLSHG